MPDTLRTLLNEYEKFILSLGHRASLYISTEDVEELEQDLRMRLVYLDAKFDPKCGAPKKAFIIKYLKQHYAKLMLRYKNKQRTFDANLVSLYAPIQIGIDHEVMLIDLIPCDDVEPSEIILAKIEVRRWLAYLSPRYSQVVRLWSEGISLTDIGKRLSVSPERACSICARALQLMASVPDQPKRSLKTTPSPI
jgi:RNA polymerase sigma factor (sigma-70 family)